MDEIKVLFDIYNQQYNQVDKIWNYFGVISMGTAGFVIGSKRATLSIKEPICILVSYLVFTIGNYSAMAAGQQVLYDLSQDLICLASSEPSITLNNMKVYTVKDLAKFYWAMVTVFCTIIVLVSWFRIRGNNKQMQSTCNASAD